MGATIRNPHQIQIKIFIYHIKFKKKTAKGGSENGLSINHHINVNQSISLPK